MVASPRNALSTSLEPPVTAGEGSTQQTFSVPCRKVTLAETIHFLLETSFSHLFLPMKASILYSCLQCLSICWKGCRLTYVLLNKANETFKIYSVEFWFLTPAEPQAWDRGGDPGPELPWAASPSCRVMLPTHGSPLRQDP